MDTKKKKKFVSMNKKKTEQGGKGHTGSSRFVDADRYI